MYSLFFQIHSNLRLVRFVCRLFSPSENQTLSLCVSVRLVAGIFHPLQLARMNEREEKRQQNKYSIFMIVWNSRSLFSTFLMISWVNYWITCFLFTVVRSLNVRCSAFCHRNNATVNEAREECFNVVKGCSSIVCWSCIKSRVIWGWFEALKVSVHKLYNLLHFK